MTGTMISLFCPEAESFLLSRRVSRVCLRFVRIVFHEREDRTSAAESLKLIGASEFERETGAVEEVVCGARRQHVTRPSKGGNAGRAVHRHPASLSSDNRDFAAVHTSANPNPQIGNCRVHIGCCPRGSRRAVEEREKAVAGGGHFPAAKTVNYSPDAFIVFANDPRPLYIANLCERRRRVADVGKQDRRRHVLA